MEVSAHGYDILSEVVKAQIQRYDTSGAHLVPGKISFKSSTLLCTPPALPGTFGCNLSCCHLREGSSMISTIIGEWGIRRGL